MAWNEPGGNGSKDPKDPWGNDQGPPDLDEAFRKFKEKFAGKGGGNSRKPSPDLPKFSGKLIAVALVILAVLYTASGFYTVDEQEQAVVLRFGKYNDTRGPGLHFNPPLIDRVLKLNITSQRSQRFNETMLTEDENIVDVSLSTQYTITDPEKFLLRVRDPETSLKHAAESALRHVIGSVTLDLILTEGKKQISIDVQQRLQNYLDDYQTGILVTTVNIEDAQPPAEVQAAFDDVIRAKEDEQRVKNEAETYSNGIIPEARGLAKRQIEEATAYKDQVIARAEGEANRFEALLTEYQKAPEVTRQRLYIDAMQKVLNNSSKVLVDVDGGNMMYLPLDKILQQRNETGANVSNFRFDSSVPATSSSRGINAGRSSLRESR
ncbi:MAG: FtsH protease activity modulator HflK [Pseudomonadales bacterium]|nr:FtsH protease activity modulator HflK [Pseudomonadales bacterium]